jgi:thiol-disulfide isomerase/thioredoxin
MNYEYVTPTNCKTNVKENFKKININENSEKINITTIYLFWASWCPHCVKFKPIFEDFEKQIKNNNIKIIKVQCDEMTSEIKELLLKYNIEGFPAIIIDNKDGYKLYEGPRTVNGLLSAINEDSKLENDNSVNNNGETVVYNFNTEWCGYSRKFEPIWNDFCDKIRNTGLDVKTINVKCDNEQNVDLCNKFKIKAYPTVIIYKNNELKEYNGSRTVDGLMDSLKNKPILTDKIEKNKTLIYNFNTTWCGYSKKFQPIWDEFTKSLKESDNIVPIDVKCDNDENQDLCEKYNIEGYPSVVIVNGTNYKLYNGPRSVEGLRTYLRLD